MRIIGKTKSDKDFFEIFLSQLLSITGGVIAGTFLLKLIDNIGFLSGFFILFPGLLEMHGNIYGSLSARLGNLLILGELKNKKLFILENVKAVLFLSFIVSFILGLITYLFVYFVFGVDSKIIILISVLSSLFSSIFEIPLTIYFTFLVFKHNLDPEDIMGPYVTTFGDLISIISLILVTYILI